VRTQIVQERRELLINSKSLEKTFSYPSMINSGFNTSISRNLQNQARSNS